jgi:hypothetical protein
MSGIDPVPRFALGEAVITSGVAGKLNMVLVKLAIVRHASGDWGELEADDRRLNDERIATGGTLVSIFKTANGDKFYVITEAERDKTTVLPQEEY